jgi:uncharacterized membrane protein (DUF4010 family)
VREEFIRLLPPEAAKILLTLFLSFLFGLEREEHKAAVASQYSFGGVRTFPLIGLIGYAMAFLSGEQRLPLTLGFAVIGGFLMLSYWHKLATSGFGGVTSEMSGLTTYLVGALVYSEQYWIATALTVVSLFLLELKEVLEGLTKRLAPEEILTFTKFLLLTAVILPILPNQDFGAFKINPFKTWVVVVAVSTISYASYVIQKVTKDQSGLILTAILGGAYSSTATTVVLAKRAAGENRPHLISGATLVASSVMYLRISALIGLFNRDLMMALAPSFVALAAAGLGVGWLWSRKADTSKRGIETKFDPPNPLELRAAFLFSALFLIMLIATQAAATYLGKTGVYLLAGIMGLADVDPFIMGITQSAGPATELSVAAAAIVIAAASNNLAKGVYAYCWSDRRTGIESFGLLAGFAALGLIPLLFLPR